MSLKRKDEKEREKTITLEIGPRALRGKQHEGLDWLWCTFGPYIILAWGLFGNSQAISSSTWLPIPPDSLYTCTPFTTLNVCNVFLVVEQKTNVSSLFWGNNFAKEIITRISNTVNHQVRTTNMLIIRTNEGAKMYV